MARPLSTTAKGNSSTSMSGLLKPHGLVSQSSVCTHNIIIECKAEMKDMLFLFTVGTNKMGIKYKGTLEIPNLSDENDMDDLDVSEPLSQLNTFSIRVSMLNENLTCVCLYRFVLDFVKTSQTHL